jgi:hypothetical protein
MDLPLWALTWQKYKSISLKTFQGQCRPIWLFLPPLQNTQNAIENSPHLLWQQQFPSNVCDVHSEHVTAHYAIEASFFKSSYNLNYKLYDLDIPLNAQLFTCNTVLMYTDISTPQSLCLIEQFLFDNCMTWPHYNPKALVAALKLVMQKNIFCFRTCWFWQKTGTAIGTPLAPPWATFFSPSMNIGSL